MDDNKKNNEIINAVALFEQEIEEKSQESKDEIERVKYYEKFSINKIDFENIFITVEKDVDGNITYHVYCGNSLNELITVNDIGTVEIKNEDLKKYLNDIDIELLMDENEKRDDSLIVISEPAKDEEMEESLTNQEEKNEETQQVEKDLQEQGEDLDISKYRPIKDSHIDERMPEVFNNAEEHGVAYSNKLHRFVMITKENGQYKINENVEPSKMTWKTIISIGANGERVERKVPHALMKTNRQNKEIAVTIGDYGEVDIETVDVLPCQERISREVRLQGEGVNKEESLEVRRDFETEGKEYKHDIAHQVEAIEDAQKDANKTVDYDITPDDYIPNTEVTWGELMEETGESMPNLIERYNREMAKEGADSKEVVETIEYDYGNVNRQHEQGAN